ncbi:FadR/GntR family transcriptional regulator [Rhodococcoides yunnanense]|uniref:FadR/GntR family transcriptional regulator n=1 Tax=Rhodococcoides yunnanense TaxID=278209 RepID=UPI000934866A|nr:FadR/GntR family transcriptional regulator [Rhodococcus yunnanensis]
MTTGSHLRPIDRAVFALGQRIADGEWPVGSKIPGETTLAADLGVGRSTVREAIRELATRGLLRTRQGAGVFVLARTIPADVADTVRRARFADVSEVRRIVEVEAAVLAAQRRTEQDLVRMSAALEERHHSSQRSDVEFVDADIAFHESVIDAAHNPVLSDLFATFVPRLRESLTTYTREILAREPGAEPDVDVHRALLIAITARNAAEAGHVVRRHLGAQE